jgi:hypothetical protein
MSAVLVVTLAWAGGCAVRRGAGAEHHRVPTVTSGSARFQILSPTLIRTEYASDRKFVDQPTFNVVGRANFARADYTTTSVDGWLTITTSAMTLRYNTDSGPFTPRNLSVHLKAGAQDVTATPWQRPTCVVGVVCEAEEFTPTGAALGDDHHGYSGAGFLAGFNFPGDGLSIDVDADSPGRYQFVIRYANAQLGEEVQQTRSFGLAVDGYPSQTLTLPPTADWDGWRTAAVSVDLAKGHHTLSLSRNASDSGTVNIDTVAVVVPGAEPPKASRQPLVDCAFDVTCEVERSGLRGTAVVASDRRGYSGTGFVSDLNADSDLLIRAVGGWSVHASRSVRERTAGDAHRDSAARQRVDDDRAAPDRRLEQLGHRWGAYRAEGRHQRHRSRMPRRRHVPGRRGRRGGHGGRGEVPCAAYPARRLPAQPRQGQRGRRHAADHTWPVAAGRLVPAG